MRVGAPDARLDATIRGIRETGATGEIRYGDDHVLKKDASEYFAQNVWIGVSQPGPADVAARHEIGLDRFMWGSDYPHDEGTHPYTREHLRSRFSDVDPGEVKMMLTDNAAKLYDFDVEALKPLGAKYGPEGDQVTYAEEQTSAAGQREYELVLVDEPAPRIRRITLTGPTSATRSTTRCGAS